MNKFITIIFTCLSLFTASNAGANCVDWPDSKSLPQSWQNPHPAEGDVVLKLSSGSEFIFREVPINTRSLYGEGTFQMGSSKDRLFETKQEVRISSAISGADGRRVLLFGKYEISKGQYAIVAGDGDLKKGLTVLAKSTGDRKFEARLKSLLGGAGECKDKISESLVSVLSEPITYLSYIDYLSFVSQVNEQCIADKSCAEKLRSLARNREVAAFFRLPAEHEWEYVARRGGAHAQKQITSVEMRRDLPRLSGSASLSDYAHVGRSPDRLIPIGSRRPIDGVYDILGNAQELMQNSFTSEIGYGAVGGYVARGGHYRVQASDMRISQRSELLPFHVDDDTGKISRQKFPYSGLRLALSSPVIGSALRLGSSKLEEEFRNEYQNFSQAKDRGGDIFAEAEPLGIIKSGTLKISDGFGKDDKVDFYSVELAAYAMLNIKSKDAPLGSKITLYSVDEKQLDSVTMEKDGGEVQSIPLVPGSYVFSIVAPKSGVAENAKYSLALERELVKDTGIPTANDTALADSSKLMSVSNHQTYKSGFVGKGDIADIYPFDTLGKRGGVLVEVSGHTTPLIARVLSHSQNIVAEKEIPPGSTEKLVAPFKGGKKGFIQIAAPKGSRGSIYKIALHTVDTVPSGFYPSQKRAENSSSPVVIDKTYTGYMGGGVAELHFKINLKQPSKLRISLTGLKADVDLRVRKNGNETMPPTHNRKGNEPEIFVEDFPEGEHIVRLALRKRSDITEFNMQVNVSKPSRPTILTPSEARAKAELIYLKENSINKRGEISGIGYYRLRSFQPLSTAIELSDFTARSDLNIVLEDIDGKTISSSQNSGSESEKLKLSITSGVAYFLRIEAVGVDPVSPYSLNFSSIKSARSSLTEGGFGKHIAQYKDWMVTKDEDQDCYAIIEAASYSPEGSELFTWKPNFRIRYSRGSDRIGISLLWNREKSMNKPNSQILVSGRWKNLNLSWKENWLKPLDKKGYIANKAIRGMTRGTAVRISGKLGGESYTIEYSLRGYSAANRAANRLCGAKAGWTVK